MSSIDERIVQMKFDNAEFERGSKATLASLEALKKSLQLEGSSKGLTDVASAANKISLANLAQGVDSIASKFSALSVVAITALTNITNKAINAGAQLVKSLTIDPIQQGLQEYETNLNSIQTILSNTQWENKNLKQVNDALAELNTYSDQTIYNFGEMARNIGTFTAAGVKLDTSVAAIKGIANLAAISGSNSQQASTAMYQLSQALATGRVALMDWNSVVNAGMGGKVFQDALKETARVHGVAIDDIIKKEGSFRDSLQKGWLTSDIMTETLSKFTGDLTASQLKTMGYNDQQIAGILKMGKTAQDAATKVKTMSQLISTLQEAAGSGWAQTWQMIFGDFEEAKVMFTNINNVLGGFISSSAEARNKVIGDWKALGGRTALIDTVSNAFNALIAVVKPIKDAFREIFPPTTGKQLYDITVTLRDFTKGLKIGADTADNLKRTFSGVFAIFGIGWEIIKQVAKTLISLFDGVGQGAGGFLEVTASIGDFLTNLYKAIKAGDDLSNFFSKVGGILRVPIKLLGVFAGLLVQVFQGAKNVDTTAIDKFAGRFEAMGRIGDLIANVWSRVAGILGAVAKAFAPLAAQFSEFFAALGQKVQEAMANIDYNAVLDGINAGLLAGIALLLKKFLSNGVNVDVGGGFLGSIKESFDALTGTLTAMQTQLKANALLKIAGAIALLTASVVALSMIDSGKLTVAITAMGAMFAELLTSMSVFEKIGASKGFAKMPFVTAAMVLLAFAIDLLAVAVAKLAGLDWEGLAKGLTGVIALIAALGGFAKVISGSGKGLITAGAGLILLAFAINILVSAVKDLSDLNWEEMAKGLTGVAGLLGALALFTKFSSVNTGGIGQGLGIVLLAAGIKILASAIKDMSSLSWEGIAKGLVTTAVGLTLIAAALIAIPPTAPLSAAGIFITAASLGMIGDAIKQMGSISWGEIGKGLTVLAGALTLISLALALLPPTSLLSAAAIFVVAASLGMIATALGTMGGMSWGEIAKSLVLLAGALGIIAVAVNLMTTALPGAAAILVVAAALRVLLPVLVAFSQMSWEEMGKGLLMLAGIFVIFGAAGLLLGPLVPVLIGLGAAIALVGLGCLAAGLGVLAFSAGLVALSGASAAGAAAIVAMVSAILSLIPLAMQQLGLGIIAFAQVIATGGPAITAALVTVLNSLITAIVTLTPKIVNALWNMIVMLLNKMASSVPQMVDAGLRMLTGILTGISNNIGKIVTVAMQIITNFINGVANGIPKVVQAGVNLIISFVNSVANAIRSNSSRMGEAGANLGMAIIEGMVRGISSGIGSVISAAKRVAENALSAAMSALGINSPSKEFEKIGMYSTEGLAIGLERYSKVSEEAAAGVGKDAILAMSKTISGMSDLISPTMDLSPTIAPVLDLSNVKRDAGQLGTILKGRPIAVEAAYIQARDASSWYQGNLQALADQALELLQGDTYNYTQYNNSPKALSEATIYRQTKNQLSRAKGAAG